MNYDMELDARDPTFPLPILRAKCLSRQGPASSANEPQAPSSRRASSACMSRRPSAIR